MKVLVTGADGLLGNNLVRELLHRKHDVSVLLQTTQKPAKS
ncbi:MAG: NAD-dependent epimerase/dehydratase family protein, partial [Bacteroidota bacterium]